MRILVVDDEALIRHFIRTALTNRGYDVVVAENGLEALQVARGDQPFDLVITDQVMPLLTGLELITRLAMERYPARYLLISGNSFDAEVPEGLPCLAKPFALGALIDTIGTLRCEPTLPELEYRWKLARKEWQNAATEMTEIISDTSLPPPDSTLRFERVAMKRDSAYQRYRKAFNRYRQALRSCGVGRAG